MQQDVGHITKKYVIQHIPTFQMESLDALLRSSRLARYIYQPYLPLNLTRNGPFGGVSTSKTSREGALTSGQLVQPRAGQGGCSLPCGSASSRTAGTRLAVDVDQTALGGGKSSRPAAAPYIARLLDALPLPFPELADGASPGSPRPASSASLCQMTRRRPARKRCSWPRRVVDYPAAARLAAATLWLLFLQTPQFARRHPAAARPLAAFCSLPCLWGAALPRRRHCSRLRPALTLCLSRLADCASHWHCCPVPRHSAARPAASST